METKQYVLFDMEYMMNDKGLPLSERPIIMGAESVRAILEERKTQTRRVIKPQPVHMPEGAYIDPYNHNYEHFTAWTLDNKMLLNCGGNIKNTAHWKCPYGVIGDRLWVRETWKPGAWRNDGRVAIDYMASPELTRTPWAYMKEQASQFVHRWLGEVEKTGLIPSAEGCYVWEPGKSPLKWKSPLFMPRFASRITLEITDIRVERLQDITPEDALKEGFCNYGTDVDTLDAFCEAWQKLNAKRGYPWESNPWVWVLTFNVIGWEE